MRLLPVFAAVPGTQPLFFICCFVVLLSVALHGGSLMFLGRDSSTLAPALPAAASAGDAPKETAVISSALETKSIETDLVTIPEMRQIQQSGFPSLVLDVRAERSFADSELLAQGALKIAPDRAVQILTELGVPRQTRLFAFCA